jgi:hypothetical protein
LALNSWIKVPFTLLPLRKNEIDKTFATILKSQILKEKIILLMNKIK